MRTCNKQKSVHVQWDRSILKDYIGTGPCVLTTESERCPLQERPDQDVLEKRLRGTWRESVFD